MLVEVVVVSIYAVVYTVMHVHMQCPKICIVMANTWLVNITLGIANITHL